MFKLIKNSKILCLCLMLCLSGLTMGCDDASGNSGGGVSRKVSTCKNGSGTVGSCVSCDAGFSLSSGACVAVQVAVTFHLNEGAGTLPAQQTVTAGQTITVPNLESATRAGFTFIGWSTLRTDVGANFVRTGATYTIPRISIPSQTLTLYATWGQAYTVTYSLNGGVGSAPSSSAGVAGAEVTLRALTLTGANNNNRPANASASPTNGFFGWGVDANGSGQTYNAETNQVFASNTTLYALWYYDITYNCGEGTASGSFPTRTSARTGEVLPNLALTGCSSNLADGRTFAGWSTTGNTPYITTMPNGPITLRAVYAVDSDGDGLIEISTAEQLNNVRYNLAGTSRKTSASDLGSSGGCPASGCRGYELVADIDLGNTKWGTSASFVGTRVTEGWEPIGACGSNEACNDVTDTPFTATFEGRGFMIRNLYINWSSNPNETGFFGAISNASVNQAALVNAVVWGSSYTASLVGFQNSGTISNNYATGVVTGTSNIGGLVGHKDGGTISNSYATGAVIGDRDIGGLVGYQESGTISNSYATGAVIGDRDIGGLVGYQESGTISNNYATGVVTGTSNIGGLVGFQERGTINDNYATGAVTGRLIDIGGLVGFQESGTIGDSYATGAVTGVSDFGVSGLGGLVGGINGAISNSYATGAVTGGSGDTGGLVGSQVGGTSTISNCYATGAVMSTGNRTGGLVGYQESGTIGNSYATGAVTGTTNETGGLVGRKVGGTISNSYATGAVTGMSNVGGLVGNQLTGTITTSYWNSMSMQTLSGTARSETDRLGIGNIATSTLTSTANGISALSTALLQSNTNAASATILATSAFYVVTGSYPKLCYNVVAGGVCSATYRLPGQD